MIKKMKKEQFFAISLLCLSLFTCTTDDKNEAKQKEAEFGNVTLSVTNLVQNAALVLNSDSYTNASGETYSVSELKYILSDFVFIDNDGNEFVYPKSNSYFLINQADTETLSLNFSNVPAGEYTSLKFGFGVDQSKYPIKSGTLNFIPKAEEAKMLWGWAAGYKFIKFEGTYKTSAQATTKDFLIHVGSHGTNVDNYKEVALPLNSLVVTTLKNTNTTLEVDIAKVFDAVNTMSLATKDEIQIDPENSPKYAANVQTMFSIKE